MNKPIEQIKEERYSEIRKIALLSEAGDIPLHQVKFIYELAFRYGKREGYLKAIEVLRSESAMQSECANSEDFADLLESKIDEVLK